LYRLLAAGQLRKGTGIMAEHKPGSMDIRAQERTFAGFMGMTTRAVVIILVLVIFMALANA
ncbi:MAG: aa3-type cytochrome c oxidase subunit IV, partial [Paracoccaceae bacterium]